MNDKLCLRNVWFPVDHNKQQRIDIDELIYEVVNTSLAIHPDYFPLSPVMGRQ